MLNPLGLEMSGIAEEWSVPCKTLSVSLKELNFQIAMLFKKKNTLAFCWKKDDFQNEGQCFLPVGVIDPFISSQFLF